jgi:Fe-S oxidoreductase
MEQKELRDWEAKCIQEEPPACRAGCPLNVDARAFTRTMAKDDVNGARAVLEKSMPLTGITARLCEAPCEKHCIRGPLGGPIAVGLLERATVRLAPVRGRILRLPARPRTVRIVGGGPSSLAAAFDLAKKGYPVTLLHREPGPGGWLHNLPEEVLPAAVLTEELSRLAGLGVEFLQEYSLHGSLCGPSAADACYVGQDDDLADDLRARVAHPDQETFVTGEPWLFTGGMSPPHHRFRFITDVSQGREAAVSIDRFLQGASLTASRLALRHGRTDLFTNTSEIPVQDRIDPADPAGFTRDEAVDEAKRCIDCQCLECVRHCVYLDEYGAYPKTYARRVYNNSAIVKGIHQANRFINSCSLCRQCEALCPKDFSMADLCRTARQQMVREQRMPASAHWFALEEMRSAAGDNSLVRHAPGNSKSTALFFPGCQLAGIRPEQTLRLHDRLQELQPATGIWLSCCAAPAHWAGRVEEFSEAVARLRNDWQAMGRPQVVTACSTCLLMFRTHLPEMDAVSAWSILAGQTVTAGKPCPPLALTDPCTSRDDAETRTAVRTLLAAAGQSLAPLTMSGELTECCGYGGLMDNAAPATARKVREARVGQSEMGFLTYCAMCRDQLARTGKPVLHLLDILFADTARPAEEPPASISARRANRRFLRAWVLTRYPGSESPPRQPWEDLALVLDPTVTTLLEERRILEDDIRRVLSSAENEGTCFAHQKDDRRIASARIGDVTFWVEYRQIDAAYRIESCWSHRMAIERGRKNEP